MPGLLRAFEPAQGSKVVSGRLCFYLSQRRLVARPVRVLHELYFCGPSSIRWSNNDVSSNGTCCMPGESQEASRGKKKAKKQYWGGPFCAPVFCYVVRTNKGPFFVMLQKTLINRLRTSKRIRNSNRKEKLKKAQKISNASESARQHSHHFKFLLGLQQ